MIWLLFCVQYKNGWSPRSPASRQHHHYNNWSANVCINNKWFPEWRMWLSFQSAWLQPAWKLNPISIHSTFHSPNANQTAQRAASNNHKNAINFKQRHRQQHLGIRQNSNQKRQFQLELVTKRHYCVNWQSCWFHVFFFLDNWCLVLKPSIPNWTVFYEGMFCASLSCMWSVKLRIRVYVLRIDTKKVLIFFDTSTY